MTDKDLRRISGTPDGVAATGRRTGNAFYEELILVNDAGPPSSVQRHQP